MLKTTSCQKYILLSSSKCVGSLRGQEAISEDTWEGGPRQPVREPAAANWILLGNLLICLAAAATFLHTSGHTDTSPFHTGTRLGSHSSERPGRVHDLICGHTSQVMPL